MKAKWWGLVTIVNLLILIVIAVDFDVTILSTLVGVWLGIAAYVTLDLFLEDWYDN